MAGVVLRYNDPKALLTDLADWFEEDPARWAQGADVEREGCACIVTGLMKLTTSDNKLASIDQCIEGLGLFVQAHGLTEKNKRRRDKAASVLVVAWNDAKRRTVKQVIKALREAAR